MSPKPVVPRDQAHRDIEQAIGHYAHEAGAQVALGFIEALERAYHTIAEHPRLGSPRYGHEFDISGLRHRRLVRYPYLVFYVERDNHIDVWRVIDARRDIPAWLEEAEDA
jgi:toxin ParE1/3/4